MERGGLALCRIAATPRDEVNAMKLLLISGHGAGDPGAVSTLGGTNYREADETRKVTAGLAQRLRDAAEVTVYPTDRNAYEDYRKGTLKSVAQFSKYDFVLEVHFNAVRADQGDGKVKGSEIFSTRKTAAAAAELAILRRLKALGFTDRGLKASGHLAVINAAAAAGTPAALLEVCFVDDADDMRLYTADRGAVFDAVAGGLMEGFGLTEEKEAPEAAAVLYQTLAEVPDWGRPTVEKLVNKGYLTGGGTGLDLDRQMLRILVINDRAGLYD